MTVLGLCCCTGFSLLLASGGASLVVVLCSVLIEVASLVVQHGLQAWGLQELWHVGSGVAAPRL